MTATHGLDSISSNSQLLDVALELSEGEWKLASSNARGQQARLVSMPARNLTRLLSEIARAKARFGLPPGATVHSCYEAGRDGFWLHRFLHHHGVNNVIVDSSSIEVNRRLRRAKADSLDAVSLVGLLMRFHGGETKVWHTVTVPHPEQTRHVKKVGTLMRLKGVGPTTASILVYEFFGWRRFQNRREVAGMAGLTPTPYQSGDSNHEQGISKAGNRLIRWIMVEVSWSWLRFQPESS